MTSLATSRTRFVLRREGARAWPETLVLLGAVTAALLLLFARDAGAMASIWWNSSTFNHCLFIPPIIGWLVAQRMTVLRQLTPAGWAPGLAIVAAGAFAWLIGDAAGVALARHLGLVVMLPGAVVSLLGPAIARALLFPIAYALFLVPFGEELVPPLQTLTAKLAMAMLSLSGVSAHIEGVFITTANGWFEVAEACSGVKFLAAMVAYGALVANVCFSSWPRRIGFMAAAVAIPVLANGLRAFATIWFASRSTADAAVGFEHVVYGWFFFAAVIALVMAIGWRFFDRAPGASIDLVSLPSFEGAPRRWVAGAALAIAVAPLAWSGLVAGSAAPLTPLTLPQVEGWRQASPSLDWRAHFARTDRFGTARYIDPSGATVDLTIAAYARQQEGRELVGFGQGAVPEDSAWAWSADLRAPAGGNAVRIVAPGAVSRDVLSFYRVGGRLTGSSTVVKLETLKARLLRGDQRAVAVLVSARGKHARQAIDRFLAALGPIDRVADRATARE